jgi:holo-[acyl-carrier protein] synthase
VIKGIGIDMVEISRMAGNIANAHFMERVFTAGERAYIGDGNLASERAAGNFAVKEALGKALGCGLAGCPLDSVEALRDERGAPYIQVTGVVQQRFTELGVSRTWVSITHTGGMAAAVVVLEGD